MSRLLVISASTRSVSAGRPLARWMAQAAERHDGFEVVPVDLAELALPFLDEPELPSAGRYVQPKTLEWSALAGSADAFVFVMPMYNAGFTAPLKNALDHLYAEWKDKPVGLVSYSSGPTGGAPAIEMLRPVLRRLGLVAAEPAMSLPGIADRLGPDGSFLADEAVAEQVSTMLDSVAELVRAVPVTV
ncbi:NADPH-dependent FMN reductase [Streptomyces sp. NPDC006879]|uniref:NADPH-dependent FMN reductase n=1 Tax=Streptomyces sp. NPDC006879 TaxID=3364767 RepID=UPI00367EEF7D